MTRCGWFARAPTVAEEQFRDLVRAREDVRGDLMRARHRLSKFLLRRELVYPGPGRAWTLTHLAWLTRLTFDDTASAITLADYLTAVEALVQRRGTLDAAIVELVATGPCAATVPVLRCFRGIDTLSAAGLCAEIGDFARFAHPRLLAGFLGITSSEHTSDDNRRQAGQDPRVCAVAWRAQQRGYRRWQRLHGQRRKPPGVVAVAVAQSCRRFCGRRPP